MDLTLNKWINEPGDIAISDDKITFSVLPQTDFWQVTHYGFSRTDGNCYIVSTSQDFSFTAKIKMNYIAEFDQAGLIVYYDDENFAKVCVENQLHSKNKLGSVVCKNKRSDWATQNFDDTDEIYFKISKRDNTFLFEYSIDGKRFIQMRLFDILTDKPVSVGVFGASPLGEGFKAEFTDCKFTENRWFLDQNDLPS
jgi:uncharacterized protein